MATEDIQVNSASQGFAYNVDKFDSFRCQSCIFMKSEFEVLTNEVKSLYEVISILKEEVNYYTAKSQEKKISKSFSINSLQGSKSMEFETKLNDTLSELN